MMIHMHIGINNICIFHGDGDVILKLMDSTKKNHMVNSLIGVSLAFSFPAVGFALPHFRHQFVGVILSPPSGHF